MDQKALDMGYVEEVSKPHVAYSSLTLLGGLPTYISSLQLP